MAYTSVNIVGLVMLSTLQPHRALLLHRHELDSIAGSQQTKGMTLVLGRLYFRSGWAKAEMALVRGKARGDKRTALKDRATQRDAERELARARRR